MLRQDPLRLPGSGKEAEECWAASLPLTGTPGQDYIERRGIPAPIAAAAGVRYVDAYAGRAAVVVGLYSDCGHLASLHGRYLDVGRGEDKMLTIGPGGGTVDVLGGWRADPLIVVEGLFDALSMAACGFASIATIGRWVPWIPKVAAGRTVWLAFDRGRSGDAEASSYSAHMSASTVRRMLPPGMSKDWNTALVKHGRAMMTQHVRSCLAKADYPSNG